VDTTQKEFFMKNTLKRFGLRLLVCITLAALVGACDIDADIDLNGDNNGNNTGSGSITWTLAQVGGVAGANNGAATADTTAITITFSAAVSLTDADIAIGGAASRNSASPLSSAGNVWTVPVNVTTTDTATVTVTKTGVDGGQKPVLVYKEGSAPPITWEAAVDGAADTTTSTKITFTFSAAVTGLTANDITRTPGGGGGATKGALTGSGTSWDLAITVTTQGTISVKIDKTGISATAQNVTVHKVKDNQEPGHPISERTSWLYVESEGMTNKIVFSTISDSNGTYELFGYEYDEGYVTPAGEGSYAWNESAETVTLTATKIAMMDNDTYENMLVDQSEAEPLFKAQVEAQIQEAIGDLTLDEEYGGMGMEEEDATAYIVESYNEVFGTECEDLEEVIEAEAARQLAEAFGPKPYTYFSGDDTLILLEGLPEPVGTDEIKGETLYGTTMDMESGTYEMVKDEDQPFEFSETGMTFTATMPDYNTGGTQTITGTYSYNATTKQLYLKPATINDTTPAQFFEDADVSEWSNYPTEADDRAAQTNHAFTVLKFIYNLEAEIVEAIY
jgi:hypothetical protein